MYVQGASLRGRLPLPLRSLRRKNRTHANESDQEFHDFTCKLTSCKCQTLHAPGYQPGPHACTKYMKRTERKQSSIVLLRSKLKANPHQRCVGSCMFLQAAQIYIRFLRSFSELYVLYKCTTTCWLTSTLSACLRRRTLIGTYLRCGFVRADALCCVVLAVVQYST